MTTQYYMRLGLLLALAMSAAAKAQEPDSELTVFGGYRFGGQISTADGDADYEAADAGSFGLIWNKRYQADTEWEVFFGRQQTEFELSDSLPAASPVDIDLYTLQLGGTYIWAGEVVRPYVAMTVGGTHIKTHAGNGESDTFISGSLGLGIKLRPGKRLGLRLEARMHGVLVRDSTELFCQTGADLNLCAVRVQGDLFAQLETFAGIAWRF